MKQSPQQKLIEANMMPGAISAHGFLGDDSRNLTDIIRDDAKTLNHVGLTQEDLADKMQELTDFGMQGFGKPMLFGGLFEIEVEEYMGRLPCPFRDTARVDKRQTTVKRLDTGDDMCWTDLNIHMIREHGFFQGHGSAYRLEPDELARFLGMIQ